MFYFLRQDILHDTDTVELIGHSDTTADLPWFDGVRFDRNMPLQVLQIDSSYGSRLPDIFDTSIPVMSTRLLTTLLRNGVSNIENYPIELKNQETGESYDNYHAVNVVGLVDAINPAASPHRSRFGRPHYTGPIFLNKSSEILQPLFRLASGPALIVVAKALASAIEREDFVAVLLQPLDDYDGD